MRRGHAPAGVLVVWTVFSLVLTVLNSEPGFLRMSKWCAGDQPRSYYCGQVEGFVKGPLILALGLAVFLFWRYVPVRHWYDRNALRSLRMVVPTAEYDSRASCVVGRDELCELMVQRLRDEHRRRPLLLVGGIGTGKTATLVRLAEMLMASDVVPVGIDLRTVTDPAKLNFHQLALEQFQKTIDSQLHAAGEADKVWRRLWLENRIVVLADGLEEVLAESGQPADRDSVLRETVHAAVRGPSTSAPTPVKPEPAKTTVAPDPAKPKTFGVGGKVRGGDFEFTVNGVKCGISQVGSPFLSTKAQGTFCKVNLTVKNVTKSAHTFHAHGTLTAQDATGREYEADGEAGIYGNTDGQGFLDEINPGNSVKANVYFDVPRARS
ncbi:DUF4352 domain-containing protein [Micromonospora sp. NPDC005299]|uniref:DUF4352 domain-containing protein n=1 Tax=Micromonospora sp. NPDC005299 TaxID=3364231 RepID=UPI003693314D